MWGKAFVGAAGEGCGVQPQRIGAVQGSALYVGAVLGTGVIGLPALAAERAGPASLIAWAGMILLSVPLAATFAALGARHPDSGGVSTYARRAFGDSAAVVVGWCFFFAIPVGAPAAALFAGAYVADAAGGGRATVVATAATLILGVGLANSAGVQVSARLQLLLGGLLLALLLGSVAVSLPHARERNLHPFAPHGWAAVGSAGALLVWCIAGWEAITHLAAEFRHPERDIVRASVVALVVVGVAYLGVAFASVAVLGRRADSSHAPLAQLMATALGGSARTFAAVVAVLLTAGVLNAYFAGAAKLGAALGRDGALPAWLAHGSVAGEIPRRSLGVLTVLATASLAVVELANVDVTPLVRLTSAQLATVYAIGVAAALRLLPRGSRAWWAGVCSLVGVALVLALSGRYLAWPLALAVAAAAFARPTSRRLKARTAR